MSTMVDTLGGKYDNWVYLLLKQNWLHLTAIHLPKGLCW